jgi:hypothetical protein
MNRDSETDARMDAPVGDDWAPRSSSSGELDNLSSLLQTQNPA